MEINIPCLLFDFQISTNVKEDLTTAQQMTLLLQSVSTWWEGSDVPVLTILAIDWTSSTMLAVKVRLYVYVMYSTNCIIFCVNACSGCIAVKVAVMLDTLSLADIDECSEGISGCSQSCVNTVGSFNCSCRSGYQNSELDHRICIGGEHV